MWNYTLHLGGNTDTFGPFSSAVWHVQTLETAADIGERTCGVCSVVLIKWLLLPTTTGPPTLASAANATGQKRKGSVQINRFRKADSSYYSRQGVAMMSSARLSVSAQFNHSQNGVFVATQWREKKRREGREQESQSNRDRQLPAMLSGSLVFPHSFLLFRWWFEWSW